MDSMLSVYLAVDRIELPFEIRDSNLEIEDCNKFDN